MSRSNVVAAGILAIGLVASAATMKLAPEAKALRKTNFQLCLERVDAQFQVTKSTLSKTEREYEAIFECLVFRRK